MKAKIKNRFHQLEVAIRQNQTDINNLARLMEMNRQAIIKLENESEQPKLKTLDQSVFDGLDEKWRFAAVDADGSANGFDIRVYPRGGDEHGLFAYESDYANSDDNSIRLGEGYDASNWKESLIERESKELTGNDLCKKMLERGGKYVMCKCWCNSYADIEQVVDVVSGFAFEVGKKAFAGARCNWDYAVPINNQGEPLTAADVDL